MGIRDNFRKIREFQKKKNLEVKMNREVVRQSIVETNFYKEYSSFVVGLRGKLNDLLVKEENTEVVFRPVGTDNAKYFERAMIDKEFTTIYHIRRTAGGEYAFKQKSLTDSIEKMGIDDFMEG